MCDANMSSASTYSCAIVQYGFTSFSGTYEYIGAVKPDCAGTVGSWLKPSMFPLSHASSHVKWSW